MQRRAVLTALATTATGGCLGSVLDISPARSFSIENDPMPDGLPAVLAAELVTTATREHPPKLTVRFECTADDPRTFQFDYPGPFADAMSEAMDGERLVLEYKTDSTNKRDGCWRARSSGGQSAVERRTFDPGDRTDIEWSVLNHEQNDSCFSMGRYRFEDEYIVDGETYEWGFWFEVH